MKVVISKDFEHNGKKWHKGQIVEFTNDLALELIKDKKAKSTDKPSDDEKRFEELREESE